MLFRPFLETVTTSAASIVAHLAPFVRGIKFVVTNLEQSLSNMGCEKTDVRPREVWECLVINLLLGYDW